MSEGRILETDSLLESMKSREDKYKQLGEDFATLKDAFQNIVDLDDFRGQGATAIKNFYVAQIEVVDEWIELIDQQIKFLSDIPNTLKDRELDEEKFVQSTFLEEDLKTAHTQKIHFLWNPLMKR